ncbi:MAG: antibiotic biosynthesis monooxygenase family protein [Gammaproteobacteria bacterium]
MTDLAVTPTPPYYAVIFSSRRTASEAGYQEAAQRMLALAAQQAGFLGVESVRADGFGITVSYWQSLAAIAAWKAQAEHQVVQALGRERWYQCYAIRIAYVERDYDFHRPD